MELREAGFCYKCLYLQCHLTGHWWSFFIWIIPCGISSAPPISSSFFSGLLGHQRCHDFSLDPPCQPPLVVLPHIPCLGVIQDFLASYITNILQQMFPVQWLGAPAGSSWLWKAYIVLQTPPLMCRLIHWHFYLTFRGLNGISEVQSPFCISSDFGVFWFCFCFCFWNIF